MSGISQEKAAAYLANWNRRNRPPLSEDELREAIASAFRKGPPCISGCRSYWEAIEEGLVSWGGGKPSGSSKPVKIRGQLLSELVLEDRG